MIWNVFFVVFVVLVLAAIGLTVWFLKLGKRIFLLIPLLLLAGSVAYFAVYHGGQRLGRGKPAKGGRQLHPHR